MNYNMEECASFKRYIKDLNLAVHACSAVGENLELIGLLVIINVEAPIAVLVSKHLERLAFFQVDQAESFV